MVALLADGLVSRGHDVTLFATGDSLTSARLSAVCPRPYEEDKSLDPKVWECMHIAEVFEHADDFDIIHNNFDFLPLSYAGLVSTPVVTTIHGFSSPAILPAYERYNGQTAYVSIVTPTGVRDSIMPQLFITALTLRSLPFSQIQGVICCSSGACTRTREPLRL